MINNKHKLSILYFLMLLTVHLASAQVENTPPMRQVLGTTGGSKTFPWGTIDYTVGEVMVTTDSTPPPYSTVKWLTQGFQQPEDNSLRDATVGDNSTCIGANNGRANLSVINSSGTVTYRWNGGPFGSTSLFENLAPDTYFYTVKDSFFSIDGSVVITDGQEECDDKLTIYRGFTPDGDGFNETWEIDHMTDYFKKNNVVYIYNRWGALVWEGKNYDNVNVVWKGGKKGGMLLLPAATYFYIIEGYMIEGGKKTYKKGWVELTH